MGVSRDASHDGLLLDHDGVLVELFDLDALTAGLRQYGEPCFRTLGVDPEPELFERFSVGAETDEVRAVARRHDVDPAVLWRCRDDAIAAALREALYAGEKEPYDDVDALESLDRPLGVVSNNQRRIVELVLGEHGLREQFDTVRARKPVLSSLDRKKPAPTYLERAMADLGVEQPLYVGDSESDIAAAHRAGIDVVYLRRDHNAGVSLDTEPTYEATTLDEVVRLVAD